MMKKMLLLFLLVFSPVWVLGEELINEFDALPDTSFFRIDNGSTRSFFKYQIDNSIKKEGTGALKVDWCTQAAQSWGGFASVKIWNPDSMGTWDFSAYTHIGLWYYVASPSSSPAAVEFRLEFFDVSDVPVNTYDAAKCEFYYSHHLIVDQTPGWHQIRMPMKNVGVQTDTGFWRPGWAGIAGNETLDLEKIKGIGLEFSVNGTLFGATPDSAIGTIYFDHLSAEGVAPINMIFFNGREIPNGFAWTGTWGEKNIPWEIVRGAGYSPGTNAIKWIQDDGWGGACGMVWDFSVPKNLMFNWSIDTLKMKIKAPATTDTIIVQFNDTAGKTVHAYLSPSDGKFTGNWEQVLIPLRDINLPGAEPGFDSTKVKKLDIMTNHGQLNLEAFFTDIWTGSPVLDVVAPSAPSGITSIYKAETKYYYNMVIWQDVPGESKESYTVYYSKTPFSSIEDQGVDILAMDVVENTQIALHYITYPKNDHDVVYYYAVSCKDGSGNVGPIGYSLAVTSKAQGRPTISMTPPANFSADGDVGEWATSGITPFIFNKSLSIVPPTTVSEGFSNDDDMNASIYLAVDQNYLYFAADVIDDVFSTDTTTGLAHEDDVIEFYLGLYNSTGKKHTSATTGALRATEPDYAFRFLGNINDKRSMGQWNYATLATPGDSNYFYGNFGTDWVVEARIPLASIPFEGDKAFIPQRGMNIPIDIAIHDSDRPNTRDGTLNLSPYNIVDQSWSNPFYWTNTWIGDTVAVGVDENLLYTGNHYELSQNYPNPFNPLTTLSYTLIQPGMVKLVVYSVLGTKVETLVNSWQPAGKYIIPYNASKLSSGVYFYRLESNQFNDTKKMMFIK